MTTLTWTRGTFACQAALKVLTQLEKTVWETRHLSKVLLSLLLQLWHDQFSAFTISIRATQQFQQLAIAGAAYGRRDARTTSSH